MKHDKLSGSNYWNICSFSFIELQSIGTPTIKVSEMSFLDYRSQEAAYILGNKEGETEQPAIQSVIALFLLLSAFIEEALQHINVQQPTPVNRGHSGRCVALPPIAFGKQTTSTSPAVPNINSTQPSVGSGSNRLLPFSFLVLA